MAKTHSVFRRILSRPERDYRQSGAELWSCGISMKTSELARRVWLAAEARVDVGLFIGAFVAGTTLYFLLHAVLNVRQVVVTSAIVAVMAMYVALVLVVPRLRVRMDQA